MSKEFTKRDGSKVVNWKDMKECDIEYGWQFKGFEDEDVKVAERCAYIQVRVRDSLCWGVLSWAVYNAAGLCFVWAVAFSGLALYLNIYALRMVGLAFSV